MEVPGKQRCVVVHVDDIGMCAAATAGALEALEATATCGSIMVPCPGFQEIAAEARSRPGLDLGVHLTLNSEWESWRWGPVAAGVPSLCDADAMLWRTRAELLSRARVDDVRRELRAQIDRALDAGIDVTHLDTHMGTALAPRLVGIYVELALEYRLPAFLPRWTRGMASPGIAALWRYRRLLRRAARAGLPVFDGFDAASLHFEPGRGLEHNRRRVEGLPSGLSYLITHCARGDDALARITPDWRLREEERRIYTDGSMARVLAEQGVRTLGMRELRGRLRGDFRAADVAGA